jgi:hypothetical protein
MIDLDIFRAITRLAIKQARQITDDQEALEVQVLYKQWDMQLGKQLNVGEYVQHNGRLYRVLQQHVAQSIWEPGQGTESLYVVIDKEHAGTFDDPIPFSPNMELFVDKHYIQYDVHYICTRDSGAPIYNDLKDLVNIYVTVIDE